MPEPYSVPHPEKSDRLLSHGVLGKAEMDGRVSTWICQSMVGKMLSYTSPNFLQVVMFIASDLSSLYSENNLYNV